MKQLSGIRHDSKLIAKIESKLFDLILVLVVIKTYQIQLGGNGFIGDIKFWYITWLEIWISKTGTRAIKSYHSKCVQNDHNDVIFIKFDNKNDIIWDVKCYFYQIRWLKLCHFKHFGQQNYNFIVWHHFYRIH